MRKIVFSFLTVYCETKDRQLNVQVLSLKKDTHIVDGSLFVCL
jgi:hypothetical protein